MDEKPATGVWMAAGACAAMVVAVALYGTAYFLSLTGTHYHMGSGEVRPMYFSESVLLESFFTPAHAIDRQIRPWRWTMDQEWNDGSFTELYLPGMVLQCWARRGHPS